LILTSVGLLRRPRPLAPELALEPLVKRRPRSTFTRAAEIIRCTGAGWVSADVTRFTTMLKTAFLPRLIAGWPAGTNWDWSRSAA